jgi:uncharacterized protein
MDLKINVGNLPKEGSMLEFCFKEADVSVKEVIGNTFVKFIVCKNGNSYEVKGFMEYGFSLVCSRCLKEITQHKKKEFNLEFKEKSSYDDKGKSGRKTGEIKNEFVVENSCLDLGSFLRDEIILSIALKPLCSEECRGLCSVCGANLNESICEHAKIEEKSLT